MNQLLKQLASIQSPSGDEQNISDFVKTYIGKEKRNWKIHNQADILKKGDVKFHLKSKKYLKNFVSMKMRL
jgi:putative aminopeptidase FrvX